MNEYFLHYLWKYRLIEDPVTVEGAPVRVIRPGTDTGGGGPDFQNALLVIGGQKWAGNVEIHLRSSDWFLHGHEKNPAYDNVILHVVWEHDVEVFRPGNTPVETLELQGKIPRKLLERYERLQAGSHSQFACEKMIKDLDTGYLIPWLERLYVERLEEKYEYLGRLLAESKNDWEAVLFITLLRNFGLNRNGEAFGKIARGVGFKTFKKTLGKPGETEALLLGQAGLLEGHPSDAYHGELMETYRYLKHKYRLPVPVNVEFFRLRPPNYPTVRLVQFAGLYRRTPRLFDLLMKTPSQDELYGILEAEASGYWRTHYTFGKESTARSKKISQAFKDLLMINTILPLRFAYYKSMGKDEAWQILEWMHSIPPEENRYTTMYSRAGLSPGDAAASQAMIHLKKNYCDRRRCLECAAGLRLLQREG